MHTRSPHAPIRSVLPALLAAAFAAAAPHAAAQPSPAESQVDALEALFGKQPAARRSGAKGVCATGSFVASEAGRTAVRSSLFSGERVPVVARFSVGGGNPKASDTSRSVRGFAIAMSRPDGQAWQMATISAPVFFVARPEQFAPFMLARTPDPATGKPDPARLKAFNDANPETLRQAAWLAKAPVPASYATEQYWSTNTFQLVDAQGRTRPVRWQLVPEAGVQGLGDEALKTLPADFLVDELRRRVAASPAAFRLQFQLAQAGDPLDDPSVAWPDDRPLIDAGRVVVDAVATGMDGACEKMTFNPLVLPTGLQAGPDPVLLARPAPYAVSLGRRLGERP
jgi:catalase